MKKSVFVGSVYSVIGSGLRGVAVAALAGILCLAGPAVDKTFADGKNTDTVMETGVYNLTEDKCTALVHFGSGTSQNWVLVRLEEPKEDEAASATPPTP